MVGVVLGSSGSALGCEESRCLFEPSVIVEMTLACCGLLSTMMIIAEVLIRPRRWSAGHRAARAAQHDSDWRAGTQYGTRHARLEGRAVHTRSLHCLHIHKSPSPTGLSVQLQTPNFVKLSSGTSHCLLRRRLLPASIGCQRPLPSSVTLGCSPLQHSILRRDLIGGGSYTCSEQVKCFR